MEDEKNVKVNSKELIETLEILYKSKDYPKSHPSPKFDMEEIAFIADIIFNKPYSALPLLVADFILEKTDSRHFLTNGPTVRRLKFLKNMLSTFNATKSAIAAGYSPKTAKQQGYRTIREIGSQIQAYDIYKQKQEILGKQK